MDKKQKNPKNIKIEDDSLGFFLTRKSQKA